MIKSCKLAAKRPPEFFAKVYAYLLEKYARFLADSRPPKSYKGQTHEPKDWEKLLYMMDSTTISLFDNILKGVGRHPTSSHSWRILTKRGTTSLRNRYRRRHRNRRFLIRGAYFYKNRPRSPFLLGFGAINYAILSFTGQQ